MMGFDGPVLQKEPRSGVLLLEIIEFTQHELLSSNLILNLNDNPRVYVEIQYFLELTTLPIKDINSISTRW